MRFVVVSNFFIECINWVMSLEICDFWILLRLLTLVLNTGRCVGICTLEKMHMCTYR